MGWSVPRATGIATLRCQEVSSCPAGSNLAASEHSEVRGLTRLPTKLADTPEHGRHCSIV